MRVLDHVHAFRIEFAGEVVVERFGHRVAGHEQRVQGALGGSLRADRRGGERVGGDRRDLPRDRAVSFAVNAPGPLVSGCSGESQPVAALLTLASGRRSAIQPAGSPTTSIASRPIPGFISSAALRIEAPWKTISSTATMNTLTTASRAAEAPQPEAVETAHHAVVDWRWGLAHVRSGSR